MWEREELALAIIILSKLGKTLTLQPENVNYLFKSNLLPVTLKCLPASENQAIVAWSELIKSRGIYSWLKLLVLLLYEVKNAYSQPSQKVFLYSCSCEELTPWCMHAK